MEPSRKRSTRDSNLKKRLATAAVGIPAVLSLAYVGGVYWTAFIVLVAGVGMHELLTMARPKGYRPSPGLAYLVLLFLLAGFGGSGWFLPGYFEPGLLGLIALSGVLLLLGFPRCSLVDLSLAWMGALYLGIFLSYGVLIERELSHPFFALLMVFGITWASDTGAYLAGRLLGKHKLAPMISPNKTWEGALGGFCLSMLVAAGIGCLSFSPGFSLLLGAAGSICAQVGDLVLSAMKRHFGVKDSGQIIPGHGGVLDRFDSFMWVLPVVYYFFKGG
ncbi:MAG: phosphatidate cytidylyltransferase [Syntrophothermus sp.]|uniref:phosphatidate cytidylyltransferase n=1 Tax=Syntrophothermus sp. TaxID=2736299 RepID=UPI00257AFA14|nr:phosphatidate cytidylyltransferase [Syntrophothermus sp.]NSW83641.1 phosphatidate cytidylyltransferase [Syntrophothermus sp.]